jgi:hypothetical protein
MCLRAKATATTPTKIKNAAPMVPVNTFMFPLLDIHHSTNDPFRTRDYSIPFCTGQTATVLFYKKRQRQRTFSTPFVKKHASRSDQEAVLAISLILQHLWKSYPEEKTGEALRDDRCRPKIQSVFCLRIDVSDKIKTHPVTENPICNCRKCISYHVFPITLTHKTPSPILAFREEDEHAYVRYIRLREVP